MKKEIIAILATIIFASVSLHVMTVWHENRHAQIFKDRGCDVQGIDYEYFDGDNVLATTTAFCTRPYAEKEHEKVHEKQEKLWVVWLFSVMFFEFSLIECLFSNQTIPMLTSGEES